VNYGRREDDLYLSEKRRKRSIVISENDRIAAAIVKIRDNNTCQMCGKKVEGRNEQWSHIVPRTHWAIRWYTPNQFTACFRCHKLIWHDHPMKGAAWAMEHFGQRYLDDIDKHDVLVKVNDAWVGEWNRSLKNEYLRLYGFAWKV